MEKFTKKIEWLVSFVTITGMIGLPLYIYIYTERTIPIGVSSSLDVVVEEKWVTRGVVYVNNEYSMAPAKDANKNFFSDAIESGDRILKYEDASYYLLIRSGDTTRFDLLLEDR